VICLEEEAFYKLVNSVVDRMKREHGDNHWKWVNDIEAMRLLNITSKTTLQEYRNSGKIRYSQPRKRIILYDRDSLNEFLEQNAKNTF
ncbi:MAG: helix-turn-helix domain-containing protein, partial [Bacteroidota bacterium]